MMIAMSAEGLLIPTNSSDLNVVPKISSSSTAIEIAARLSKPSGPPESASKNASLANASVPSMPR